MPCAKALLCKPITKQANALFWDATKAALNANPLWGKHLLVFAIKIEGLQPPVVEYPLHRKMDNPICLLLTPPLPSLPSTS